MEHASRCDAPVVLDTLSTTCYAILYGVKGVNFVFLFKRI